MDDVTIEVNIPETCKSKEIQCAITPSSLSLVVKGSTILKVPKVLQRIESIYTANLGCLLVPVTQLQSIVIARGPQNHYIGSLACTLAQVAELLSSVRLSTSIRSLTRHVVFHSPAVDEFGCFIIGEGDEVLKYFQEHGALYTKPNACHTMSQMKGSTTDYMPHYPVCSQPASTFIIPSTSTWCERFGQIQLNPIQSLL